MDTNNANTITLEELDTKVVKLQETRDKLKNAQQWLTDESDKSFGRKMYTRLFEKRATIFAGIATSEAIRQGIIARNACSLIMAKKQAASPSEYETDHQVTICNEIKELLEKINQKMN